MISNRHSLATLHGLGTLVNLVTFFLAPPALLRLWTVCSGVPLFAAVVALVRFRAVILHMTLRANKSQHLPKVHKLKFKN